MVTVVMAVRIVQFFEQEVGKDYSFKLSILMGGGLSKALQKKVKKNCA